MPGYAVHPPRDPSLPVDALGSDRPSASGSDAGGGRRPALSPRRGAPACAPLFDEPIETRLA